MTVQVSKHALISLLGTPRTYYASFAKVTGDVCAGVLASQFFFWYDRGRDPDGWIYKTRDEIYEETGLTRRNQETARRKLIEAGFLEEQLRGMPAKLHYRLNIESLMLAIDVPTGWRKAYQPVGTDRTNKVGVSVPTSKRESRQHSIYTIETSIETAIETPPPPSTIGTHRDHSDHGGGGSPTRSLPIAAADLKPAVKAQTTTTTAPQQTDPRRTAQIALINEIIADRLPSWNGHQAYAAGLSTLDACRLLTWLWAYDQLARAAESNAYDPDAIREAERIERDYGRVFTGIDNPVGFIRKKVTSGESTHLNAADAAELEEAIVARTTGLQPAVHD